MGLLARGLVAGYRGAPLLGPLDLSVPDGRFVCLIGANGAGKSTLIRTLCAMQPALAGEVLIDGASVVRMTAKERARALSVVLTDRVQVALMTGRELASLGRYPHVGWRGRLDARDHALVSVAMEQAGAARLADHLVSEMSDGERQKVLIARALAQQPRLLVLDEATAFLDLPRRVETMQLLRDLARQHRLAVLLSSHDLELAMRYADALWVIDPQRQLHTGAPEDLALNGVLGATFAADGLAFDLERGELVVGRGGRTPMRLVGDGVRGTWAKRALERAGFVVRAEAPQAVHVSAGGYTLVHDQGTERRFETLHDLVEQLLLGEPAPQRAIA